MLYRSAKVSHSDELVALSENAGLSYGEDTDRREIRTRLEDDDGLFLVGVDDAGVVQCSVMGCYDNHRGWVKRFAVDPILSRKGHGQALFAELERH